MPRFLKPHLKLLLASLCCALLGSCGWFKQAPADTTPPTPPELVEPRIELVGRIASVPAGQSFVLIQVYQKKILRDGSVLMVRGAGLRAANLLFTGEKLGHYAAADIQSGSPEVGDAVYRHTISDAADNR